MKATHSYSHLAQSLDGGAHGTRIGAPRDLDGGEQDGLRALGGERLGERRGLLARARDQHAPPGERASQRGRDALAHGDHVADDEQRGRLDARLAGRRGDAVERCLDHALARRRRLDDQRRWASRAGGHRR